MCMPIFLSTSMSLPLPNPVLSMSSMPPRAHLFPLCRPSQSFLSLLTLPLLSTWQRQPTSLSPFPTPPPSLFFARPSEVLASRTAEMQAISTPTHGALSSSMLISPSLTVSLFLLTSLSATLKHTSPARLLALAPSPRAPPSFVSPGPPPTPHGSPPRRHPCGSHPLPRKPMLHCCPHYCPLLLHPSGQP